MKRIYFLLHIAVILVGFSGIFGKLISLNEGLIVWYRLLFSCIILFLIIKIFKINSLISFTNKIDIAKVGILLTLHWIFFYASIKYSNVSIGVICYCLTGFFTAIFKPVIRKQKFRLSELMLSSLTLLGISLIFHFDSTYRVGIFLGIVSSVLGSLYTIYNEGLVKSYDSISINYYQMAGGLICLSGILPFYLYIFPTEHFVPDLKDTFYLILLSFFCTVGVYIAVAEVLKKIPAFTVNLTFNLEPVYAVMLAFLLFGEGKEVNLPFYTGLLLIMISVVLQTLITIRSKVRLSN